MRWTKLLVVAPAGGLWLAQKKLGESRYYKPLNFSVMRDERLKNDYG
jgi:hypothetical protein